MKGAVLLLGLAVGAALTAGMREAAAQMNRQVVFGSPSAAQTLFVRTATDLAALGPVIEAFVVRHPDLRVEVEDWNTNELAARSAEDCRAPGPDADLVLSSAVDLQVRLVNDGCARPHMLRSDAEIAAGANWRNELFGVTEEPVVMVYNRSLVPAADVPRTRFDLLDLLRRPDGTYRGRIATYDIERSGVGYLFAFLDSLQATTFGGLLEAFGRSGTVATCCSAEIIEGVASGRYLLAYNVLGSYAAQRLAENPDLGLVLPEDYTLVLRRAAFIPREARNPAAAGMLVDFLLSVEGRAALRRQGLMTEMPVAGAGADLSDGFLRPIALTPALLVGLDRMKRAKFLATWHDSLGPAAPGP